MSSENSFKKLPETIIPKHYHISLIPNLINLNFFGEISVDIEIIEPTNDIKFNALNLEINSVTLMNVRDSTELQPLKIVILPEDETANLNFSPSINAGSYVLKMSFKGLLEDNMKGFYRSKHEDESGIVTYSAVTQFAPTDARRCFPCWDEPAIKATFDINLTVPKDLVALSNMPVVGSVDVDGLIRYTYDTTPKMSTYLVAVLVGHFDYCESKTENGVLLRVYTPKGKSEQGLFALDVTKKVLPYYETYFKIPYPLPKLDLVAVASLSYGAMENWGLITYRECRLLVDAENTSAASKQATALTVGHELTHQWFGNLVTMEWWTDLWLNEGYASFMQFLCIDRFFPEYDIWSQFLNNMYIPALELDGLSHSHPIEVLVNDPSEINEIFDSISYNKGASIIRMLVGYIGNEKFEEGMHLYLSRHRYGNMRTGNLWDALAECSRLPVSEVMSTWTKQMGFPLLKVTAKQSDDETGISLTITQQKFVADGSVSPEGYTWMVPITISTSSNRTQKIDDTLLSTKSTEIFVPNVGPSDWIKINPGAIGYYRTQYTGQMLDNFVPDIKSGRISPIDRLMLLNDLFAMVKAGLAKTTELLKFLRAFEDETNSNVWCSIVTILGRLGTLLSYTDNGEAFRKYQKTLLNKIYLKLGWNPHPSETHVDALLRSIILNRFASLGDENMMKEARERFSKHVKSEEKLSADLRSACYKCVLLNGGRREFETLLELYRSTDLNEEKMRIVLSLGCTRKDELLKELLQFGLSDEVKTQDSTLVISSVAQTKPGRDLAWQFLKNHWDGLTGAGPLLSRLVKQVTENFASTEKADDVRAFFGGKRDSRVERSVQQALETIALNVAWLERDADDIKTYLNAC
ncbi:unnamed protein product [Phaedon cochleariae]|uniref:Aminopeptidase n=1 Tax=Phaedon cochleariae TaxID=80249 RepID=A0A9P0DHG3_PHACE|nr:unnamed protein product [Phaedon cochleariae]